MTKIITLTLLLGIFNGFKGMGKALDDKDLFLFCVTGILTLGYCYTAYWTIDNLWSLIPCEVIEAGELTEEDRG